jgi:hypothetical protein
VDKSSLNILFLLRKGKALNPAENLESDGHFLSVHGQTLAVNGQKPLAIVAENRQGVVRSRTKWRAENGRKQSKPAACDSAEEGGYDLHDESERPGKGRNHLAMSIGGW